MKEKIRKDPYNKRVWVSGLSNEEYEYAVNCVKDYREIYAMEHSVSQLDMDPPPMTCDDCIADFSGPQEEETETTMYSEANITLNEKTMEIRQQEFLLRDLSDSTEMKKADLKKQFGLTQDDRPRTAQELIDRIASGKFTLPDDLKEVRAYNPVEYIVWRDPSIKKDEAGYNALKPKLESLRRDTERTIMVSNAADGLAALKAFETTTIQ
jgi:hypothetical protein